MGCDCSTFSAVIGLGNPDPSRHVNYVTGMVLGVDDYAQEFAYHSARDKRMVRDFLGYGTLSGLAVSLQDDAAGPRVMVSAGAAAAPSGQQICVGRDQCGSINDWLKRPEVKAELDARAGGAGTLGLTIYLTLCYTDCAVDAVPIPGEPCRSLDNLMAPSRRADDYVLAFAFDPPLEPEVRALAVVDAWIAQTEAAAAAGGESDPANFKPLIARARAQIIAALGIAPGPLDPADLAPVELDPAAVPAFTLAMRQAWITLLRPLVMAQTCAAGAAPANDCVLLGALGFTATLGVIPAWSAPVIAQIALDERERPLMLSAMATQSALAPRLAPPPNPTVLALFNDASAAPAPNWPISIIVAANAADMTLTLPVGGAGQADGDRLTLIHGTAGKLTLTNARQGATSPAVLTKRGQYRLTYDTSPLWTVCVISEEQS